jgi:hypothetical protein
MNLVERLARKADQTQQGVRPLAFAVGEHSFVRRVENSAFLSFPSSGRN